MTTAISRGQRLIAYAGLVTTMALWAGNAVVARAYAGDIPPLALAFWRWCLALVLLAPLGLPRLWRQRERVRRHWAGLILLGILSVGLFNTLLYVAAQTTGAMNITLLNTTMPTMVMLLAMPVLGERPRALAAVGIGLGLAGVAYIVARGDPARLAGLDVNVGDLVMLLAVLCWCVFSLLLRRHRSGLDPLAFLTAQIVVGIPVILPFYLVELAGAARFAWPGSDPGPFLFVAAGPGLIAFAAWNHGVRTVGPSRAALFFYLIPLFAAALAIPVLGEALQTYHLVGAALVFASLWLATRPRR